jgi:hypothetical protein
MRQHVTGHLAKASTPLLLGLKWLSRVFEHFEPTYWWEEMRFSVHVVACGGGGSLKGAGVLHDRYEPPGIQSTASSAASKAN